MIDERYFEWLLDLVYTGKYSPEISYRKLLIHLHERDFIPKLRRDKNRASDGVDLRRRFALLTNIDEQYISKNKPCSVLEMMVALAIRCEETIMDSSLYGDRTRQWFWEMMKNLELTSMTDDKYDRQYVNFIIDRFNSRKYHQDGRGSLFVVRTNRDMRRVEIWYQMMWYLDAII